MASPFLTRQLPLIITFALGATLIGDYYVTWPPLASIAGLVSSFGVVIAAFALCLGAIYLTIHNLRIVMRKGGHWPLSLWLVAVLWIFIIYGVIAGGVTNPSYRNMFTAILPPTQQSLEALTGLATISGAVRAFRARNYETAVFMLAALVLILNLAPIGAVIWSGFGPLGQWILDIPNTAGVRGIIITVAVGSIVLSLRTLIGRERGYLGTQ